MEVELLSIVSNLYAWLHSPAVQFPTFECVLRNNTKDHVQHDKSISLVFPKFSTNQLMTPPCICDRVYERFLQQFTDERN